MKGNQTPETAAMNSSKPSNALGQYRKTGAHGAAAADDRLQLVLHMMQGALDRIATARGHMKRSEVAEKGQEIGRAIGLIDGLRVCLDKDNGGDIAGNLEALYEYMLKRLVEANLEDDPTGLDEVANLLGEIKSAWQQMAVEYHPVAIQQVPSPDATV
jgi:flagellar protein FliS